MSTRNDIGSAVATVLVARRLRRRLKKNRQAGSASQEDTQRLLKWLSDLGIPNTQNSLTCIGLDLSSRSLRFVPSDIRFMSSLVKLDISWNGLESIPVTIGHLRQLEKLNVSHNSIRSFPPAMFTLPKLEAINASHNDFENLQEEISRVSSLKTLDMSFNSKLAKVPLSITQCKRLEVLRINGDIDLVLSIEWGHVKDTLKKRGCTCEEVVPTSLLKKRKSEARNESRPKAVKKFTASAICLSEFDDMTL